MKPAPVFAGAAFLFLGFEPVAAEPAPPASTAPVEASRIALGLNVLGAQVDWRLGQDYRAELRYVAGSQGSDLGTVTSNIVGFRGYRVFRGKSATRPYLGLEAAYVDAKTANEGYSVAGAAGGAFAGVERRLWGRLWAGIDVGPYLFSTRERSTRESDTSLEFVLNSFLLFYVY